MECSKERDTKYNGRKYQMGEKVFIQKADKKRGIEAKVFFHDGSKVWVMHNGTPTSINEMCVQPIIDHDLEASVTIYQPTNQPPGQSVLKKQVPSTASSSKKPAESSAI